MVTCRSDHRLTGGYQSVMGGFAHDPPGASVLGNTNRLPRTDRFNFRNDVPSRSVEFLGESDEKPFRPADVAKAIRILIADYFAYELCAALAKPAKRLVKVVNREHDAVIA